MVSVILICTVLLSAAVRTPIYTVVELSPQLLVLVARTHTLVLARRRIAALLVRTLYKYLQAMSTS